MAEEFQILEQYLQNKQLRNTPQRYQVLEIFLKHDKHLSAEELYHLVKKKYPAIGQATVFRAVKTLCAAGLATKIQTKSGIVKYEHAYKHQKHAHLLCDRCSELIEFNDPLLKELQYKILKKYKFQAADSAIKISGLCEKCLRLER